MWGIYKRGITIVIFYDCTLILNNKKTITIIMFSALFCSNNKHLLFYGLFSLKGLGDIIRMLLIINISKTHSSIFFCKFYLYYGIISLLVKLWDVLSTGSRVWPARLCLTMRTKAKPCGIFCLCHLICYDSHEPSSPVFSTIWLVYK